MHQAETQAQVYRNIIPLHPNLPPVGEGMTKLFQRFIKRIISLFIFTTFVFYSAAYATTTADTLTQLLNNITTMQANFTQTITDKSGRSLQQSSGRMSLSRPGKFRWDVKQPNAQLVLTNGSKLWVYDPDLEQVTVRVLTKEAGEAPALLLSDTNESLAKKFNVQMLPGRSGLQWFLLTPRSQESMFQAIKLGFANNQIQQMDLQDDLGHTTHIQFTQVVMNKTLSAALFTFKPPANVDVINETK